ncbi:MAG: hypothetical protein KJ864_03680, partial [Candidatus Omnitrophica bacterium]|nr:hypothetical protein [Candidatus Omnitrophota bacterium]
IVKRFVITIFEPNNKTEGISSSDSNEFRPLALRQHQTKNLFPRTHQNCGGIWLSYELNRERFQLQSAPPIVELLQTFIDYEVINEKNYKNVTIFFERLLEKVKDLTVLEEDAAYFMIANLVEAWLISADNYDKILDLIEKINLEAGMFKRETFENLKSLASVIGTNARGRDYFPDILKHMDVDYLISLIENPGEGNQVSERAWIAFDFIRLLFHIRGITEKNIARIKQNTVNFTHRSNKKYIDTLKAYEAFGKFVDEKKLHWNVLEKDTDAFIEWLEDDSLPPITYMEIMRTIHDDHIPPEPVSVRRDGLKENVRAPVKRLKTEEPKIDEVSVTDGRSEIEFRAEIFKYGLMRLLQKDPKKIFAIAFDSNIGEDQKSIIMPIFTAVDQIRKMVDSGGHPLFPNLRVLREQGKSGKLMIKLNGLIESGTLDKERIFLVARKENVDNDKFKALEGSSWIAAIDDLSNGEITYLPVFEALSLIIMSAQVTNMDNVTEFYNKISDKTEKELQEMLKDKLIYVLPKTVRIPPQRLRELYDTVKDIYLAA